MCGDNWSVDLLFVFIGINLNVVDTTGSCHAINMVYVV